jgi:hypothetical protein
VLWLKATNLKQERLSRHDICLAGPNSGPFKMEWLLAHSFDLGEKDLRSPVANLEFLAPSVFGKCPLSHIKIRKLYYM